MHKHDRILMTKEALYEMDLMFNNIPTAKKMFFNRYFPDIEDVTDWIMVFPNTDNEYIQWLVNYHSWAVVDENNENIVALKITMDLGTRHG